MGARISLRPRLLIVSLVVAVVVSIVGGFALAQIMSDDDEPDAVLDEPGEYQEPIDEADSGDGSRLPDVEVYDVDEQPVKTGSFVGEPLVINVWYPTCAPCKREMPDLAEVSAEYEGRVRFVGVNTQLDVDAMVEFAEETGVEYDLFIDELGEFVDGARVVGFPTTLFVDRDGTVVKQHNGPLDADEIRTFVEQIA